MLGQRDKLKFKLIDLYDNLEYCYDHTKIPGEIQCFNEKIAKAASVVPHFFCVENTFTFFIAV